MLYRSSEKIYATENPCFVLFSFVCLFWFYKAGDIIQLVLYKDNLVGNGEDEPANLHGMV